MNSKIKRLVLSGIAAGTLGCGSDAPPPSIATTSQSLNNAIAHCSNDAVHTNDTDATPSGQYFHWGSGGNNVSVTDCKTYTSPQKWCYDNTTKGGGVGCFVLQ